MADNNQEMSSKFYPLPCMFTLANLFCGFYAIVAAINSDFQTAAIAILVGAIFDGLDGRVARMTGTCSTFGIELDSLCDLVSFGVAPAILAYLWALQPFDRSGWLAGFLYVATTALRLARFNTQSGSSSKDFTGLPCPAAAAMISSTVIFCGYIGMNEESRHISLLLLVYILSYLMVSTHRYLSFKNPRTGKAKTFQMLVAMVLTVYLIGSYPQVLLFSIFLLYCCSGPSLAIYTRIKQKTGPKSGDSHTPA